MDARYRSLSLFVASQLVFLSGLIHVTIGVQKWLQYASVGILLPPDIRWPLFVASGAAVIAGIGLTRRSTRPRRWYLAGAVVMLGYVAAYFCWHLSGHRPLFVLGPGTTHDLTLGFVVAHYFAGPLETLTLTVQLIAATLLVALYLGSEE